MSAPAPADPLVRDIDLFESFTIAGASLSMTPQEALKNYCLLILNANEFIYLD